MKTIFSLVCCFVIFSTATSSTSPQIKDASVSAAAFDNSFVRFNAHRQGQAGTGLSWVFSDPNNVVCFVVERSYDGDFYEQIAQLPANGRNQYKDTGLYLGYLYYRIAALMYDGSTIYSNVEIVRIVRNG